MNKIPALVLNLGFKEDVVAHQSWFAVFAVLLLSGCASSSLQAAREEAIISSTRYDHLSCQDLMAERDRTAARYGLSPDAELASQQPSKLVGLNPFIPDLRSKRAKEIELARGQIHAMNRSMERRSCPGSKS